MAGQKEFTFKQVVILVIALIAGFAFLETSGPIWSWDFWRVFLLKLLLYGAAAEVIVIILGTFHKGD